VLSLCTARRAWTLDLADLTVYESDEPTGAEGDTLIGIATAGRLMVGVEDSAAEGDDTVAVDSQHDLIERVADEIVEALHPVFAAVRSVANFGLVGMWGAVVDDISAAAVTASSTVPLRSALETSDALVKALKLRTRHVRLLPSIEMVAWSGGITPVSVKGNCCMRYKTQDLPDQAGEGFCEDCPKRDRAVLIERHRARFEAGVGPPRDGPRTID
jgi:hypothetical protein